MIYAQILATRNGRSPANNSPKQRRRSRCWSSKYVSRNLPSGGVPSGRGCAGRRPALPGSALAGTGGMCEREKEGHSPPRKAAHNGQVADGRKGTAPPLGARGWRLQSAVGVRGDGQSNCTPALAPDKHENTELWKGLHALGGLGRAKGAGTGAALPKAGGCRHRSMRLTVAPAPLAAWPERRPRDPGRAWSEGPLCAAADSPGN